MFEDRAGVHHRLVEHQPEEVVSDVVMRGNAPAGPRRSVAVKPAQRGLWHGDQWAGGAAPAIEHGHVERRQARELGQFVAVEPALHVSLPDAERSTQQRTVEAAVVDRDANLGPPVLRFAEGALACALDDRQRAVPRPGKQTAHERPHRRLDRHPTTARSTLDCARRRLGGRWTVPAFLSRRRPRSRDHVRYTHRCPNRFTLMGA